MFKDILRHSEAVSLFCAVLKCSRTVLSRSLAFWNAVSFLGIVMVCMFCERFSIFLRHSHGFWSIWKVAKGSGGFSEVFCCILLHLERSSWIISSSERFHYVLKRSWHSKHFRGIVMRSHGFWALLRGSWRFWAVLLHSGSFWVLTTTEWFCKLANTPKAFLCCSELIWGVLRHSHKFWVVLIGC